MLKVLLRASWAPDAAGTPGLDDDLYVFRDDPEFAALLEGS